MLLHQQIGEIMETALYGDGCAIGTSGGAMDDEHMHDHTGTSLDGMASESAASSIAFVEESAPASASASSSSIPTTTIAAVATEPAKKTGRPAHPLWEHFHRGEKRNRYHYHSFCVYCVERYGAAQVPPTRGVSIDMLRHLEKCTNCPRHVVEHIKEVCGRRDAVRFDRYGKKKQQQQQQEALQQHKKTPADPVASQPALVATQANEAIVEEIQRAALLAARSSAFATTASSSTGGLVASTSMPTSSPLVVHVPAAAMISTSANTTTDTVASVQRQDESLPPAGKRQRTETDSSDSLLSATSSNFDHKLALLRLVVASNLSPDCLRNEDFQQMICALRPSMGSPSSAAELFAGVTESTFLQESSVRLAGSQLDRVKEGMLNSTIKGGVTLSLHSWTTLDGQHLVAFNLVNSNGDSACVSVEDMAIDQPNASVDLSHAAATGHAPYTSYQLAAKIENVLAKLQTQNISVMGIVADSTLALNAARRVCANNYKSLLVVPCFSRVLSVLAGAVLTHPHFASVVGEMIELAAYLLNAKLLQAVRTLSGDPHASFVLPNRQNWFSFVDCHAQLVRYQTTIVKLCQSTQYSTPHAFQSLVLRDDGAVWTKLSELGAFLAPLHETYSVFFQHKSDPMDAEDAVEDDLSAAHGLTLAHVMYQFARMMQQYQTLLLDQFTVGSGRNGAAQDVAQLVLIYVDTMWRRYELPAMLLAFVFNFHLDTTLLDMNKPCSAWPTIAQYFLIYYRRWFGGTGHSSEEEITSARIDEILDAIKLNQFPFDADTTSDYVDVSSFYSFVSDSHPEICALCCRLYAISLYTANTSRIVRGVGYVPNAAQTTRDPEAVQLLLHVGFASSMRRTTTPVGAARSALGGMEAMLEFPSDAVLWSRDIWQGFADDWRLFVDQELLMDEFDAISTECSSSDVADALLAVKVPVQELFLDTLPAMTVTLEVPTTPRATTMAAVPHSNTNPPASARDGILLNM